MQAESTLAPLGGSVVVTCPECGLEHRMYRSVLARGYKPLCSATCRKAARAKRALSRVCRQCGKSFVITTKLYANRTAEYCSKACFVEWRRQTRPTEEERAQHFWTQVDKDGPVVSSELGPCWVWTGYCDPAGYGRTPDGEYTHRYSWVAVHGEIENKQVVRHKCDNPPCVNPDHLEIGTQRDNVLDRERRGRHPRHRITADLVRRVHADKGTAPARIVAERQGVTADLVYRIWQGKTGAWALQE